jgi:transcriptional regulator with XRE-family HTH domain
MSIGKRLSKYLKTKRMTQDELATKGDISKQTVFNIVHDKTLPSGDVLTKIQNICTDLNLNWLISNIGDMLIKTPNLKMPNITVQNGVKKVTISHKGISNEFAEHLEETIAGLLERLNEKERVIKAQEETINIQKVLLNKFVNSEN